MKPFAERNLVLIGAIGVVATAGIVLAALEYDKLPFLNQDKEYSAYFAEAGGLRDDSAVQVSGVRAGKVSSIDLDGPRVLVKFKVDKGIRLGERTEAAIKTKSLLGSKILTITPRGDGQLTGPIPLDHTTPAYQLPDALGDLASTVRRLNTDQVSDSLETLAQTFSKTPPDLKLAVEGLSRFSQTLDARDAQLRSLLVNANKVTTVLAQRVDQVVGVITDANALLAQLRTQSAAVDHLSTHISAAARQISGLIDDNRQTLRPALDKLNGVLTILDTHQEQIRTTLRELPKYLLSLGECLASGPYFSAYIANLLPGQFVQPYINAAFSDLGLDPNVLAPGKLHDPQTGQPGTPPLPLPYPRTGQGGSPRLTIPDAITGNPSDQPCGPPGTPLPGPGCYPLRPPPPPPPPGGPPPGPPAPPPGAAPAPGDMAFGGGGR